MPHIPRRFAPALAMLALLAAGPVRAQQGSAVLAATITSSSTGEPLRAASVVVQGTRQHGQTGDAGTLSLERIPAGRYTVEVSLLGYTTRTVEAVLEPERTTGVNVALDVQPVALEPVEADVSTWGRRYLEAHGFYDRRHSIPGNFFTREQIEHDRPRSLSFMLRRFSRLQVRDDSWGSTARPRRSTNTGGGLGRCAPTYFVNGVMVAALDIESIPIGIVEGVEVYSGAAEVPPGFNRDNRGGCGAIIIWTRIR